MDESKINVEKLVNSVSKITNYDEAGRYIGKFYPGILAGPIFLPINNCVSFNARLISVMKTLTV